MAEDVITLLDYVGWTGEKEIHVVGISLGGMIAQGGSFKNKKFPVIMELQSWH